MPVGIWIYMGKTGVSMDTNANVSKREAEKENKKIRLD